MNSSPAKSTTTTTTQANGSISLINYEFDFGLSTKRPRPMNGQKQPPPYTQPPLSSAPSPFSSTAGSSLKSNRASWSHQPKTGACDISSTRAGDISGRSWNIGAQSGGNIGIGIVDKNPNLFGDLVSSALGQDKGRENTPSQSVAPSWQVRNLSDRFSKANISTGVVVPSMQFLRKSPPNRTGPSMQSLRESAVMGTAQSTSFENSSGDKTSHDDAFGDFLNASDTSKNTNTSGMNQPSPSSNEDPLGFLFSSQSTHSDTRTSSAQGHAMPDLSESDDWAGFIGAANLETTATEFDWIPARPPEVSPLDALDRGTGSQKRGQHAEAIQWLSQAVILLENKGDVSGSIEALSYRASSYREVGEYKKAVADCTKVLLHDPANVSVLVHRSVLYESMEKYRLAADDLRTVMKLDPSNRVARSTIHRLNKMAQ